MTGRTDSYVNALKTLNFLVDFRKDRDFMTGSGINVIYQIILTGELLKLFFLLLLGE